jgi:4-hydroxy-2-oxoheptanedioate aldolase
MAAASLVERFTAGDTVIAAWSMLTDPMLAEASARAGFECVIFDVQHGLHDVASLTAGISAVALAGRPAAVRLPVGDMALASRALDLGAEMVIAPMVNSAAEARALVAATKYPPLGERSWGPSRAMQLNGREAASQLETANRATFCLAMIETTRAIAALDEILATEGLDGVFVGPSDLSVTLSGGKRYAPLDPANDATIRMIAERAAARGKLAGVFSVNAERAAQLRGFGFRLVSVSSDLGLFTGANKSAYATARG